MSDQDDTLLDEDLGDEEYDLGNDEEEALLADDYEIDRRNSYKGEEETDDVLELGVTDALDDLDAEDENNDYSNEDNDGNPTASYINEQHHDRHINYFNQEDNRSYNAENIKSYREQTVMHYVTSDLREKLQKSIPKEVIIGEDQGIEDDDYDEAKERRNRFQNERTMVSPKINNEIPDSLENVVTADHMRMSFRGRGRGRGIRGARGARYGGQITGICNPRYPGRMSFDDQNSQFRPPLLEARPPIYSNVPSNQMNTPIIYHQNSRNSHIPLQFQRFPHNVSPHPRSHYNEPRPPFNSNRFHNPSQTLRPQNPQIGFVPHGLIQLTPSSRYNGPQNPQFILNQPRFQRPLHEAEVPGRTMVNHGPIMIHQSPAMHPRYLGMPAQCHDGQMTVFRPPGPNQVPQIQHSNGLLQNAFENHSPIQEPRNIYESIKVNNQPSLDQFNNPGSQVAHHQIRPPISHVSLAPGHKILINPHFRGNVQPAAEVRPFWEPSQPPLRQQQLANNEQFRLQSGQFQDQQAPYNQQSGSQGLQTPEASQDYKKKNSLHNKNDDPYAYFSDVWQENKTSKSSRSSTSPKSYSGENYSRDTGYRDYEKYKSNTRNNYPEDQRYRDRSPPTRSRDHHSQRSRSSQSNNDDRHDSHVQRLKSTNSSHHPPLKAPQKRTPEAYDRIDCGINQKRSKKNIDVHGSRSVATHNDSANSDKEEDMDPEMQDYKKKLEEQKRLREKILQEKENRRKQAAMNKQIDDSKNTKNSDSQQESKSLVSGIKKETMDNRSQLSNKTRIHAESDQPEDKKAVGGRVMRTMIIGNSNPNYSTTRSSPEINTDVPARSISCDTRRVVMQKSMTNVHVAPSLQKVIFNIQKPLSNKRSTKDSQIANEKVPALTKVIKKAPLGVTSKPITVNEQLQNVRKILVNDSVLESAKRMPKNRVVIQQPILIKRTIDNKTNVVIVQNLSASTTETQIRKMCHGIGTIETIMIGEGTATIVFKTHSAALVFHKKYHRKTIDLSMIDVRLVSQAGNQKPLSSTRS